MSPANEQEAQGLLPANGRASSLPRDVKLLGAASFLNDVASEMIFPLMPQFLVTELGGNRFHLGLIEGVADFTSSLLKLWSGASSDRAGRRKHLIVVGYLLPALARPSIGIASLPWHLFAARTADRIGKGIRTSPRDALITDASAPGMRGRAFGFHRAMDHLGAAIGPAFASLFLLAFPSQWRLLFGLTLIPGTVVVGLLGLGLRESRRRALAEAEPARTREPFNRGFRLYLVALVVFTLGNSSDAFLLLRAGELGVPVIWLPMLWCAFHVVKTGMNLLAGRWVDEFGPRPLVIAGWLLHAATYLGFALSSTSGLIWVLFLLYGVAVALAEPAERTLVTQLVGADRRGLAFGWFNLSMGIAALPASLIFGWLYEQFSSLVAFGWGAGLALVAALLLTRVRRNE